MSQFLINENMKMPAEAVAITGGSILGLLLGGTAECRCTSRLIGSFRPSVRRNAKPRWSWSPVRRESCRRSQAKGSSWVQQAHRRYTPLERRLADRRRSWPEAPREKVMSRKVNFWGQGNKASVSGEERANILLLACCYQEVSTGWAGEGKTAQRQAQPQSAAPPGIDRVSTDSPATDRAQDHRHDAEGAEERQLATPAPG